MSDRDLEGWTIAFDLDGTLVDSAPDLIGTLNRMLVEEGLPAVPMESASTLIGSGARALLVQPPGQLPAQVDRQRWLKAANELAQAGQEQAARQAVNAVGQ